MQKTIYLLILLLSTTLIAQVTNQGTPKSWELKENVNSIQAHILPKFDLEKLQKEDLINDKLPLPFRFGYKHDVNYGFNDGVWTTLNNGDRIWRIKINSKNALSLNVIFDTFFMPKGGKVYLYNDNKSDLLGAYTAIQNQESNMLGTWLVKGETIWVEYYEPKKVKNKGKLHISTITHGYRGVKDFKGLKNLGDSGNCNQDVDCPIGNATLEDQKNSNKKAVGILLSGGSGFCSGALINNTANDQTPYFLTANHCYSNPAAWSFRFGWISPNPVCATTANSPNGPTNMTISGGTLKARNGDSDFCLVQINSAIPPAWDRTWSGWDNTDTTPTAVVGIHHPRGDIMKVCRDDNGTIPVLANDGVYEWEITTAGSGWELGVTEGGSSGSPLYNQDGRIIGQLHRGGAACAGTVDNGSYDQYGRLAKSWTGAGTNTTRLSNWLDPNGTGQSTIDGYPAAQVYALDAGVSLVVADLQCGQNQINPNLVLTNYGTTTLTSATITWNLDGGANTTINWTGSLAQNMFANISLANITLTGGSHSLNATVSNPNNGTDENNTNNASTKNISVEIYNTTQIHLDLLTDTYSDETTWSFKDENGAVLYSGGPYNGSTEDSTHFLYDFNVSPNQCYTFTINDSANDGICCNFGAGSYTLTDDNTNVIFTGGGFGTVENTEFSISSTATIAGFLTDAIKIYPNPVNTNLTIDLGNLVGDFNYTLINTLGQKVQNGSLINSTNTIDVSNINSGIYFIKIEDKLTQQNNTRKLIIQ